MRNPKALQLEKILKERASEDHFTEDQTRRLSLFYELALKWNKRLHLTTITEPWEFVERHILESAFAASQLQDEVKRIWDLGTGMGIPGIPLAIFRPDLEVNLVDSNRSKTVFLEEVISELRLINAKVICARIESLAELPEDACLTARAVDRMEKMLPDILRIGANSSQLIVFGTQTTESIVARLLNDKKKLHSVLIPGAGRRRLVQVIRFT